MEQTTHASPNGTARLEERLNNPDTAQALNRLLDRLDTIEEAVEKLNVMMVQGPAMLAMMTDVADDVYREADAAGVDLDERLRLTLQLAERLTAPRTVEVLSQLMERMDDVEELIALSDQVPGFVAMMVDMFDDVYRQTEEAGYDLHKVIHEGPEAFIRINEFAASEAFKKLLDSGVLDPQAIEIVGKAGDALVDCSCQDETPEVGLFGLLRAMRDPDTRRALGFLTAFGKRFGQELRD
jgi:uncharacterized protein YjgD (DUF1641 family)